MDVLPEMSLNPYLDRFGFRRVQVAPLVSVVTVVYQDRDELNRIIDNIAPFRVGGRVELVVVDGGSYDGSVELLQSRSREVEFWLSEPDLGIYDAMNKGVAAARGHYILHINAGDSLLAIPYGALPESAEAPAWVSCQVREDDRLFEPRLSWITYYANTNNHQGSFYRRDMHLGYKTNYKVYADFEHHLRLLAAGIKPALVYELVAEHDGGGVSADPQWFGEETRAVRENFGRAHALIPKLAAIVRRWRAKRLRLKPLGPSQA